MGQLSRDWEFHANSKGWIPIIPSRPMQGIIKPALQRLCEKYAARARELAEQLLSLQVTRDRQIALWLPHTCHSPMPRTQAALEWVHKD